MPAEAPDRIGPFTIDREIGRGGMGVVYLGRDERLDRSAALKALPESLAGDAERITRFQREARLLSGLSHPCIASVYGMEEADGRSWLVMEYVEGESLAERLLRGPLPVEDAIGMCAHIAGAVEHAHEQGVIHRDLKPGNVRVTPAGAVKVLDFGLAKALDTRSGFPGRVADSPTLTAAATLRGEIMGTAAYMSPEQARGKAVDRRTDIWSFGCVLYECLSGEKVFQGETTSDSLAAVLERRPDWSRLPDRTPQRIKELLERCLEKDSRQRLRDIGDARLELERALAEREWTGPMRAAGGVARGRGRAVGVTVAAALVGLGAGWGLFAVIAPRSGLGAAPQDVMRLAIPLPAGHEAASYSMSDDGRTLLVRLRTTRGGSEDDRAAGVYLKRMDEPGLTLIRGTEKAKMAELSRDGRWIAAIVPVEDGGGRRRVLRLPVDGSSTPLEIGHIDAADTLQGIEFLPDGDLAVLVGFEPRIKRFGVTGELAGRVIPLKSVERMDYVSHLYPLGDGRHLTTNISRFVNDRYLIGSAAVDVDTGEVVPLVRDGGHATFVDTGHLLFARGDSLLAAPFDIQRMETTGAPVIVGGGLRTPARWEPGEYTISPSGCLLHGPGGLSNPMRGLAILDRSGRVTAWSKDRWPLDSDMLTATPDAAQVAVCTLNAAGLYEVWRTGAKWRPLERLVWAETADTSHPILSPDGRLLAYTRGSMDPDRDGVYVRHVESNDARRVFKILNWRDEFVTGASFTPDGSSLLVQRGTQKGSGIILVSLREGGEDDARQVLWIDAGAVEAEFSPDGRAIAAHVGRPGSDQCLVYAYDPAKPGVLGEARAIPISGATEAEWSGRTVDGRQELIVEAERVYYSALIAAEPALEFGEPQRLFDRDSVQPAILEIEPLADGTFLIIQAGEAETPPGSISVVLNWKEEFKRRLAEQTAQR